MPTSIGPRQSGTRGDPAVGTNFGQGNVDRSAVFDNLGVGLVAIKPVALHALAAVE